MDQPSDPSGRAQLPPLPTSLRTLTDEQLGWLRAEHPDLSPSPRQCPTCRGKRVFRWWRDPEHTEAVEYDCPCEAQWTLHLRLLYAGIGENYQRLGWADFYKLSDEHERVALEYLDGAEAYLAAGIGLMLHGRKGGGKTMLGVLVAKELVCLHRVDALVITFADLLQRFSGGWRDAELRAWFASRVRNARLLFIDDVGREHRGERSISQSTLEDVLRHRAQHSLPTFLSSNHTPAELAQHYGPHTASVLSESMIEVEFDGSDRRPAVLGRKREEILARLTRPVVIS